jgi:hypothetical protein
MVGLTVLLAAAASAAAENVLRFYQWHGRCTDFDPARWLMALT